MNARIEITSDFLDTYGAGTLIGTLARDFDSNTKSVTLFFPQTSFAWKMKHGGPRHFVVSEHVIECLLRDVLELIHDGFEVNIQTFTQDPAGESLREESP